MTTVTLNKFKFSDNTKNIISNFARINPAIMFRPGRELRTVSPNKDLLGIAKIEENIPQQFGIYDLSRFLSILSTFKEPVLSFKEQHVTIQNAGEGSKKYNYRYTAPNMILAAPTKNLEVEDEIATFHLSTETLIDIVKTLSVSKHPKVAFVGEGNHIYVRGIDDEGVNSDLYEDEVGATNREFSVQIKIEKLQALLETDYKVTLTDVACLFESNAVKYFIAPEANEDE